LSKNKRFTYNSGLRYRSSKYLLTTLDTKGEYNPVFVDFQTSLTYEINSVWSLQFLGNVSQNRFRFSPDSLVKAFGTYSGPLELRVFYDGSELDEYLTNFGAIALTYEPSAKHQVKYITSAFYTSEQETFDIEGAYLINEVDNSMNPGMSDSAINIAVGAFHNHARNFLDAYVVSNTLKGTHNVLKGKLKWGVKWQYESVLDDIREWERIDSAGYSLPYSDTSVNMFKTVIAQNEMITHRFNSFLQHSYTYDRFTLTAGVRASYWNFNKELLVSPRSTFSYLPKWKRNYLFRFSFGYYYQPPFYRELRFPNGEINKNIRSQKSLHYVLGFDRQIEIWERDFKWITEVYYKDMEGLIPYKIDNVRLRYAGANMAKGYAAGMDMKLHGEFVKGVESWMSLSLMQTKEDIIGDSYVLRSGETVEPGYYPRPTDQLINFGMFFQDYLPGNPTYKMNVTLYYGTGLPFTSPYSERYDLQFRMPAYKRVDVGFSKVLISQENAIGPSTSPFKSLWVGLEVFNLFDINNRISHIWIKTLSSTEFVPDVYAVPVYLTGRRLNVKVMMKF
jgi:hypothetical protein